MNTAASIRLLQAALRPIGAAKIVLPCASVRRYHPSPTRHGHADVFNEALTEMRVRTPWIEALRKAKETGSQSAAVATDPVEPDLTPKKMSDSYFSFIIPLAQDPWTLDVYGNANGKLRLGSLLMDLDALAGVVAYKHTGEGVSTVTAAVDRITIKNPPTEICDLELSGQVTYASGRSSMEITLQIAKAPTAGQARKPEETFMTCTFTMVALNPVTKRAVNVAPLKIETEEERKLYERGEENYKAKKALKASSITAKAPDPEESALLHKMWTESLALKDKPASWPANTKAQGNAILRSAQIMQPQFRNRHNFMIFGGFLLKQTFELAFTVAAAFSHSRPVFLNLDPSTFEAPVPVGSVLYLSAAVTYSEPDPVGGTRVLVTVRTHVREVEHKETERKNTGTFFYTFHVDTDVRVLPQTYNEFMRWVSGRRRAHQVTAELEADALDVKSARKSGVTE